MSKQHGCSYGSELSNANHYMGEQRGSGTALTQTS